MDSQQLESLPLNQLSVDNSGPPQVTYETDNPLAASTLQTSSVPHILTANTKHDRQIIPGIPHKLYPSFTTKGDICDGCRVWGVPSAANAHQIASNRGDWAVD